LSPPLRLQEAWGRSGEEQRALVRCQLELQDGVEAEANALYVDEVVCARQRERVVVHNF